MIKLMMAIKGSKELAARFKKLGQRVPSELEKSIYKILYAVQRSAKKNLTGGNPLNVRENRLRGSVQGQVSKHGKELEGRVGTNVIYGPVHEYGKVIYAKGKPMVFEIGDKLIFANKVTIPKRPWLIPALEDNRKKAEQIFGSDFSKLIRAVGL